MPLQLLHQCSPCELGKSPLIFCFMMGSQIRRSFFVWVEKLIGWSEYSRKGRKRLKWELGGGNGTYLVWEQSQIAWNVRVVKTHGMIWNAPERNRMHTNAINKVAPSFLFFSFSKMVYDYMLCCHLPMYCKNVGKLPQIPIVTWKVN